MNISTNRRQFLATTTAGACAVGMTQLIGLPAVSRAEAELTPHQFRRARGEVEALSKLIAETPRERCVEEVAMQVRQGKASYRDVVTALLLAGVKHVQPRPSVGHKFHAVLVVSSAHIASLSSPDSDRWLPIFWAVDNFKSAQAANVREGFGAMQPVDDGRLPAASAAPQAFCAAMDAWDAEAADAAVAALARHYPSAEVFSLFFRYAARDFRSIGHKAIYVAGVWRLLDVIGWEHAEPVLRSLAFALLAHSGEPNPAQSDLEPDRPWRESEGLIKGLNDDWRGGKLDDAATRELLAVLREGSPADAMRATIEKLNRGVAVASIWDAAFAGAAELVMRQPAIVPLHAMTTTNAVHQLYLAAADEGLQQRLLLQNMAFITMFRDGMGRRGNVAETRIDEGFANDAADENAPSLETIFAEVGRDRSAAGANTLAYLQTGGSAESLIHEARRLIFLKGNNAHDYKFSTAALEDFYSISPAWRNQYLAASTYLLRGASASNNGLVERIRSALG